MKLSPKQIELTKKLKKEQTYVVWLKGRSPSCFVHNDLSYSVSTATVFAMKVKGVLTAKSSDFRRDDYYLTELGELAGIEI